MESFSWFFNENWARQEIVFCSLLGSEAFAIQKCLICSWLVVEKVITVLLWRIMEKEEYALNILKHYQNLLFHLKNKQGTNCTSLAVNSEKFCSHTFQGDHSYIGWKKISRRIKRRIFLTSVRIFSLKQQHFKHAMFQVTLSPFEKVVSIYSNDSPLKIKKNVFYFMLKGISC